MPAAIHRSRLPSSAVRSIARLVKIKRNKKLRIKQVPKLKVTWETVPNPDPEALRQALEIIFRRRHRGQDWKPERQGPQSGEQQELPL
jgi:hypothetical protein